MNEVLKGLSLWDDPLSQQLVNITGLLEPLQKELTMLHSSSSSSSSSTVSSSSSPLDRALYCVYRTLAQRQDAQQQQQSEVPAAGDSDSSSEHDDDDEDDSEGDVSSEFHNGERTTRSGSTRSSEGGNPTTTTTTNLRTFGQSKRAGEKRGPRRSGGGDPTSHTPPIESLWLAIPFEQLQTWLAVGAIPRCGDLMNEAYRTVQAPPPSTNSSSSAPRPSASSRYGAAMDGGDPVLRGLWRLAAPLVRSKLGEVLPSLYASVCMMVVGYALQRTEALYGSLQNAAGSETMTEVGGRAASAAEGSRVAATSVARRGDADRQRRRSLVLDDVLSVLDDEWLLSMKRTLVSALRMAPSALHRVLVDAGLVLWDLKEELETLLMRLVRVRFLNTTFLETSAQSVLSATETKKKQLRQMLTQQRILRREVHRSQRVVATIPAYQQLCHSLADSNVKLYAAVSYHTEGLSPLHVDLLRTCFSGVLLRLLRRQASCNATRHDYKQLLERRADEASRQRSLLEIDGANRSLRVSLPNALHACDELEAAGTALSRIAKEMKDWSSAARGAYDFSSESGSGGGGAHVRMTSTQRTYLTHLAHGADTLTDIVRTQSRVLLQTLQQIHESCEDLLAAVVSGGGPLASAQIAVVKPLVELAVATLRDTAPCLDVLREEPSELAPGGSSSSVALWTEFIAQSICTNKVQVASRRAIMEKGQQPSDMGSSSTHLKPNSGGGGGDMSDEVPLFFSGEDDEATLLDETSFLSPGAQRSLFLLSSTTRTLQDAGRQVMPSATLLLEAAQGTHAAAVQSEIQSTALRLTDVVRALVQAREVAAFSVDRDLAKRHEAEDDSFLTELQDSINRFRLADGMQRRLGATTSSSSPAATNGLRSLVCGEVELFLRDLHWRQLSVERELLRAMAVVDPEATRGELHDSLEPDVLPEEGEEEDDAEALLVEKEELAHRHQGDMARMSEHRRTIRSALRRLNSLNAVVEVLSSCVDQLSPVSASKEGM